MLLHFGISIFDLNPKDTQSKDAPSKILSMSGNSEIMPNGIPALLRTYHINIKFIHALSGSGVVRKSFIPQL